MVYIIVSLTQWCKWAYTTLEIRWHFRFFFRIIIMFCAHCSKMSSNCSSKSFIYISKTFWSQISAFWIQLKSVCIAWVIKLICRNTEISDSNANKNYMLTHWRINWYGWCGNQSSSKKMQIMLVCCRYNGNIIVTILCMYVLCIYTQSTNPCLRPLWMCWSMTKIPMTKKRFIVKI